MSSDNCLNDYKPKYHIRYMTEEDVSRVLQIWADNSIYEGTHTIQSFLKVDPQGFVVAVEDETGIQIVPDATDHVLGMCAGVFVNPETAFIGLYAVDPSYQKLGIGNSMWRKIMEHIGDRNVGLCAASEHRSMYMEGSGFKFEDSRQGFMFISNSVRTQHLVQSIDGIRVQRIDKSIEQKVIEYDEEVHQYSRAALLPHVFAEKDSITLVAIDESNSIVVGYGSFRTDLSGWVRASPLYANNESIAELLTYQLIKAFPTVESKGLKFLTLDNSTGGIRIAEKLGLTKVAQAFRLFKKFVYNTALWERVHCIHTANFDLI